MLKCCSLYSGSTGNSFFIQTENTKILVDCGVTCKRLENALTSLNTSLSEIDGVFITHEHIDHTKCLGMLASKYHIPIFVNPETWIAISSNNTKLSNINVNLFKNEEHFEFKDLKILPFSTPHDAANPCGFNIFKNEKKISIVTDLGHISNNVVKHLENSVFLMIEANYDSDVLKYSHYPYMLKKRIAGTNGHLDNCVTGQTIAHLINSGLENALLIHLSKENNFPELAYKTVLEELHKKNILENSISLNVAPRDYPSNFFQII